MATVNATRFARSRPVVRGLGLLLHIPALMALASLPVCLYFGEEDGLVVLGITAATGTALGQALYWLGRGGPEIRRHHAMLVAALAWLAVSAVGTLPFVAAGAAAPLDAAFESLSGFTATGLTVLTPSELPHYLQWWRSLSEWIGGVGVIVLLLTVLPATRGALELYYSEGRDQKMLPTVRSTVQAIWSIYLVYTLLGIGLLWAAGEPFWRALNHGMTAIATGGFSITDDSLASAEPWVKAAYLPIMVAGAISFFAHYRAVRERQPGRALFGSAEQRLFWGVLIAGAAILVADNMALGQAGWLDSLLQWVSAVTTTGFQSVSLSNWHTGPLVMLIAIMLVGATAGSTGGGLKMMRVTLLYKSMVWSVAAITRRPHQVLRLVYDGQALAKADARAQVRAATTLTIGWLSLGVLAVTIMAHCVPDDVPLQAVLFEITSAQSNVGLSSGLTGPELSAAGKITLMAVMWMGRLEIVPVMVLIALALGRGPGTRT